jgi:hypothetical protein
VVLTFTVGFAVVLAAALGHTTERERRAELAAKLGSTRPVIACDRLEAIAHTPLVLPRKIDTSLLEESYAVDLDRSVVRIDGDLPDFTLVQPIRLSGPSVWTGLLHGLRDAVAPDRDSVPITSLAPNCNQ